MAAQLRRSQEPWLLNTSTCSNASKYTALDSVRSFPPDLRSYHTHSCSALGWHSDVIVQGWAQLRGRCLACTRQSHHNTFAANQFGAVLISVSIGASFTRALRAQGVLIVTRVLTKLPLRPFRSSFAILFTWARPSHFFQMTSLHRFSHTCSLNVLCCYRPVRSCHLCFLPSRECHLQKERKKGFHGHLRPLCGFI